MKRQEATQVSIPDYEALKQNIIDVVVEEQIKIGYQKESIQLYYPVKSVTNLLGTETLAPLELINILDSFKTYTENDPGKLEYTLRKDDRVCFIISEEAVENIHNKTSDKGFLKDFIEQIRQHSTTIEDIKKIFSRYSSEFHCEELNNGEFDYLLWFESGIPDSYKYCINFEGDHVTYHRFTKKDFEDLNF